MINILYITGQINYTDGVASHLYNLTNELIHNNNFNLQILCSGGDAGKRFRDSGIPVTENIIFDHSGRSIKNFSAAVKFLIKLIRKNKIDIIHSHNHYAANISYYASKFTKVRTLQTIHGLIPEGGFLKHFRSHKYISVNESIEAFLKDNVIIKSKDIHFISQGFRYDGVINKKPEDEVSVICASRLVYDKGIDQFIKAARIVKDRYPGKVRFLIAGKGDYENELRKLAENINSDVVFLGEVKNIPELLSGTNIFVMPTRSSSEGLPMTIVEAAFTKNLIITSEFDFLGNDFKDGIDGYTFKVDNYVELAEKILTALNNPELTEQMAETFFYKSKNIFDLNIMIEKHIDVYKECLKA